MKAQQDQSENMILKAENDNLKNENYILQAALRSITCSNCGGSGLHGDISIDHQHLHIENARLKDELEHYSSVIPHNGRPIHTFRSCKRFTSTVIMEAQQVAPFGMKCKDKFLIQSTVVSFGTTDEQITPGLFRKDNGRHIDESKLRVVLVTPPHSPACDNEALKVPAHEGPKLVDAVTDGVENLSPPPMFIKDLTQLEVVKLKLVHDLDDGKVAGSEEKCKLTKDVEELNSKLKKLESNLNEVETTISRLRGERNMATKDEQTLKREFKIARTHESAKEVQVGFSFLFVCLVILISLELGYELLGSFPTGTS